MKVTIEKITPEMALKMLEFNPNNRPLNEQRVIKYANQMKEKLWQLNGEAIIFSDKGRLIDGQHRLNAIVRSGKTIETVVSRGVKNRAFETVDTGTGRSAGDLLSLNGISETNAGILASIIKQDIRFSLSGDSTKGGLTSYTTPQKVLRAHKMNPAYLEALEWLIKFPKNISPMGYRPMGFLVHRMLTIDEEFSKQWIEGFITGAEIPKGDSRLGLIKRFDLDKVSLTKLDRRTKMAMVVKCWHHAREGKQFSKVTVSPSDWEYIKLSSDKW